MTTQPKKSKSNFYIVNDVDRPQSSLVAYESDKGVLNYLDRTKKAYDGMELSSRSIPIEDFGFEIIYQQDTILFSKNNASTAKYPDGRQRSWQGDNDFSHNYPTDMRDDATYTIVEMPF